MVLAPERTRTVSPPMAPFKKRPFHMAMQAVLPIIPIVIYNSGDVAPKGDFVLRSATVKVEALPPVDTGQWSLETMDEHVREVRNMFARALGQPEQTLRKTLTTKTKPKVKPKAKPKAEAVRKRIVKKQ